MQKMGWFGAVRGHSMSWAMPPYDRVHTTSYSTLMETMCLSFAVFKARCYASAVLHVGTGLCLCLSVSVCLSVTSRCSTKTAKRRITQTTPHDSPGTLVFWYQRSTWNSTGVTSYESAECRWGGSKSANFLQIIGCTRKRYKIDTQFLLKLNRKSYAINRMVALPMNLSAP